MNIDFSVEQAVRQRRSVRTYEDRPLSGEDRAKLAGRAAALTNPFGVPVDVRLLDAESPVHGERLGTYGVIRGARTFIGASVEAGALSLEGLGYSVESLVLYAASLGLGTCFLGGTFRRGEFARAMGLSEGALLPVVLPIGYPADKRRVGDALMRLAAGSDRRKPWDALFFRRDFAHPLTAEEAGAYAFPLEMLRLAPSAANRQPWRVVQDENAFHFYEDGAPDAGSPGIDLHRLDLGIAACHFDLAAAEKGLAGTFGAVPPRADDGRLRYRFSRYSA